MFMVEILSEKKNEYKHFLDCMQDNFCIYQLRLLNQCPEQVDVK